ncbi:hypothetical protein CYMTET_13342, partial [Cymbomonas tetramitiformis]
MPRGLVHDTSRADKVAALLERAHGAIGEALVLASDERQSRLRRGEAAGAGKAPAALGGEEAGRQAAVERAIQAVGQETVEHREVAGGGVGERGVVSGERSWSWSSIAPSRVGSSEVLHSLAGGMPETSNDTGSDSGMAGGVQFWQSAATAAAEIAGMEGHIVLCGHIFAALKFVQAMQASPFNQPGQHVLVVDANATKELARALVMPSASLCRAACEPAFPSRSSPCRVSREARALCLRVPLAASLVVLSRSGDAAGRGLGRSGRSSALKGAPLGAEMSGRIGWDSERALIDAPVLRLCAEAYGGRFGGPLSLLGGRARSSVRRHIACDRLRWGAPSPATGPAQRHRPVIEVRQVRHASRTARQVRHRQDGARQVRHASRISPPGGAIARVTKFARCATLAIEAPP